MHFPQAYIGFLGKDYTRPVIEACSDVDIFIRDTDFLQSNQHKKRWDIILHIFPVRAIAQKAGKLKIPVRIGTTNRLYHWWTCNKLVTLSRKKSDLHEAQLNLKLLEPLGVQTTFTRQEISNWNLLDQPISLPATFEKFIVKEKYNLILHPKSQGSAREWGVENFIHLIQILDKNKFNILVSGTAKERLLLNELFNKAGNDVTDITGLMTLTEFIAFINQCDGLLANSTGPLHIASALGKDALGIYPPIRPMHPGRWAPLGKKAKVFVLGKNCSDCRKDGASCSCIRQITPQSIADYLNCEL